MTGLFRKIDPRDLAEKAALLMADENPIVKAARKKLEDCAKKAGQSKRPTKLQVIKESYAGLSIETLRQWIRQAVVNVDDDSLDHIVDGAKNAGFKVRAKDFLLDTRRNQPYISKYDLGEKFGMDFRRVQEIVDEALFGNQGHIRGFYLESGLAIPLARRYKGLYHLYHFAPSKRKDGKPRVLRSALRIRYALQCTNKAVSLVRCKLHVPNSNRKDDYIPYDGVLTERGDHLYWFFEEVSQRTGRGQDMVSIVGQHRAKERPKKINGVYMSVTESQQIYSSAVYLTRTDFGERHGRQIAKQLMRDDLKVYQGKGLDSFDRKILKHLAPPYTPLPPI